MKTRARNLKMTENGSDSTNVLIIDTSGGKNSTVTSNAWDVKYDTG